MYRTTITVYAVKERSKYSLQTLRDNGLKSAFVGHYYEDDFKRIEKLIDEKRRYKRAWLGEQTSLPSDKK